MACNPITLGCDPISSQKPSRVILWKYMDVRAPEKTQMLQEVLFSVHVCGMLSSESVINQCPSGACSRERTIFR